VVIEAAKTLLEGRISTLISKSSILFLNLKTYPLSDVNYKSLFCPSLDYGKRRCWLKRDLNSALMKDWVFSAGVKGLNSDSFDFCDYYDWRRESTADEDDGG
jgi:hypothetical protein|tara:strand:- start:123 stop:428 length:306 start_codon:yes stop_codon:yes gene_type:complete